ncbi:nuclear pore complex component-domain-containing protein [Podospora didyma]|uniref:Nuclear pore complex component-domain-containing protein n=1 Tax=Podospora didyma TaxID=330526 RepID=A0AAE0NDB4_9PEZI|nr:nuclear pore complex component-domain-containing protein [Podospora didyma]
MSSLPVAPVARTPVKQTPSSTVVEESPGNWRHPKLTEITRRQSKTVFSEKNVNQIVYNAGALALLVASRSAIVPHVPAWIATPEVTLYGGWFYIALLVIPLFNIAFALLPLFRSADDVSDIPLTPAQRQLLGLPPSSKPTTPNSVYSTPPRYSRTPSLAGSPASIKSFTTSSPNGQSPKQSQSPYSPAASPLLQKAIGAAGGTRRRTSFGSPSPLNQSLFGSPSSPGTPTPASGKKSSVSLNNKWLYEKGRRISKNL